MSWIEWLDDVLAGFQVVGRRRDFFPAASREEYAAGIRARRVCQWVSFSPLMPGFRRSLMDMPLGGLPEEQLCLRFVGLDQDEVRVCVIGVHTE